MMTSETLGGAIMALIILFVVCAVAVCGFTLVRSGRKGWRISSNGNQTLVVGYSRLTVFKTDYGWKYCIAGLADDDEPYFSDTYGTELAAKECGVAFLHGEPPPHQSMKEIREANALHFALEAAAAAPDLYSDCRAKIETMVASGRYTLAELRPVKKKAGRTSQQLLEAYKEYHTQKDQQRADEIWTLRSRFQSLEAAAEELIGWIESGAKKQKAAPPDIHALLDGQHIAP